MTHPVWTVWTRGPLTPEYEHRVLAGCSGPGSHARNGFARLLLQSQGRVVGFPHE
jgi:hypothetical protein